MNTTFTRRMFLLPRRAMVLIDLRFRSNSNVANVCNLQQVGSNMSTNDIVCRVLWDGLHVFRLLASFHAVARQTHRWL
jgi:hypothetical protein